MIVKGIRSSPRVSENVDSVSHRHRSAQDNLQDLRNSPQSTHQIKYHYSTTIHPNSPPPKMPKTHIETVGIVGVGGQVGVHIVEHLLKAGKQVTALMRGDSKSKVPSGVTKKTIDYDDHASIVSALQGIDAFLITMAVTAPEEQQTKLLDAAADAGVPWILPNEWGINNRNEQFGKDILIGAKNKGYRDHIEKMGKSNWIGVSCGFWYEYSLALPWAFGFDIVGRKATFYSGGNTKMCPSSWPQTGLAVAKLLSLPISSDDKNAVTLDSLKNGFVNVHSFHVNQRDMFASLLRVTDTKESDWTVEDENVQERYKKGMDLLQSGSRAGFGILLYARPFYDDAQADFVAQGIDDNSKLGLKEEDLDTYTKVAVQRAVDGVDPFNRG